MNFLNPSALWLIFLIIIPIIIHLFQFRRYKKVVFSATQFLKAANEKQKRKRRLKHLLILTSRILFILFFVFFLAKPTLQNEKRDFAFNNVIVDTTPSNSSNATGKSTSVLEENQSHINTLEEELNENIVLYNSVGKRLSTPQQLTVEPAATSIKIPEDKIKSGSYTLILSDFQKNSIDENTEIFKDSLRNFILQPAFSEAPKNVFIDSVWVASNNDSKAPLLSCRLQATGQVNDITVQIKMNQKLLGTSTVDLADQSTAVVQFQINQFSKDQEYQSLSLHLSDANMRFDNTFHFVFENEQKKSVLLLNQNSDFSSLEAIFTDNELFNFRVESLSNYNYNDLNNYDFLIAVVNNNFSTFAQEALLSFAQSGKPLFIIPGKELKELQKIKEFGFTNISYAPQFDDFQNINAPDYNNPFFENVFTSADEQVDMPFAKPLLRWQRTENLLTFTNGFPFLGRSNLFSNTFLIASPLNESYTNLEKHSIFLPLLYKMTFSIKDENAVRYSYLTDRIIKVTIENLSPNSIIKLEKGELTIIPDQRLNGNEATLILPENGLEAGFYTLKDSKSERSLGEVALNIPKSESEEGFYTSEQLSTLFQDQANIEVIQDFGRNGLEEFVKQTKEGFPLWKYFLMLALLCLLAEVLLIRFLP